MENNDDHHHHLQIPSPSLKQVIKTSLCCFPKTPNPGDSPGSDSKARLVRSSSCWVKSPELKGKCRNFISKITAPRPSHSRRHSADYKYDALSYSLNFDDEGDRRSDELPLRNFANRLPASPPSSELRA